MGWKQGLNHILFYILETFIYCIVKKDWKGWKVKDILKIPMDLSSGGQGLCSIQNLLFFLNNSTLLKNLKFKNYHILVSN